MLDGIHDYYRDIRYIELSVTEGLSLLAYKIPKEDNKIGIENTIYEFYSKNLWINSVLYTDISTGETITVPLILNEDVIKSIPVPLDNEFDDYADRIIKKEGIYIPQYGFCNIYYQSVLDKEGKYIGYVAIIIDTYNEFNLHPMIIGTETEYDDYISFITSKDGTVIYSSVPESLGEKITEISPYFDSVSLIIPSTKSTGAYQYSSQAFYEYARPETTEKITAWHNYENWGEKITIYIVKELDKKSLDYTNVYPDKIEQMINDVRNLYYFDDTNGFTIAKERVDSNYYSSDLMIVDYNGNVLASDYSDLIGMSILNNRDVYGYLYASSAISTAKQGGGFVYCCYPVESINDCPAFKFELIYVLSIGDNRFIYGRCAADNDIYETDETVVEDLVTLSRSLLQKIHDNSIYKVINLINADPDNAVNFFADSVDRVEADISVFDYYGKVYASIINQNDVGSVVTDVTDIYGGSSIRKAIILARNGGGFSLDLVANPTKEGYVDLWLVDVEPVDNNYFINTAAIVGTFEDKVSQYI